MDIVGLLITIGLFLSSIVTQPTMARCGEDFYVNGARDGIYECRRNYNLPDDCTKKSRGCVERPDPNQFSYRGRLYCTGGMITVQDGRKVWCARPPR